MIKFCVAIVLVSEGFSSFTQVTDKEGRAKYTSKFWGIFPSAYRTRVYHQAMSGSFQKYLALLEKSVEESISFQGCYGKHKSREVDGTQKSEEHELVLLCKRGEEYKIEYGQWIAVKEKFNARNVLPYVYSTWKVSQPVPQDESFDFQEILGQAYFPTLLADSMSERATVLGLRYYESGEEGDSFAVLLNFPAVRLSRHRSQSEESLNALLEIEQNDPKHTSFAEKYGSLMSLSSFHLLEQQVPEKSNEFFRNYLIPGLVEKRSSYGCSATPWFEEGVTNGVYIYHLAVARETQGLSNSFNFEYATVFAVKKKSNRFVSDQEVGSESLYFVLDDFGYSEDIFKHDPAKSSSVLCDLPRAIDQYLPKDQEIISLRTLNIGPQISDDDSLVYLVARISNNA